MYEIIPLNIYLNFALLNLGIINNFYGPKTLKKNPKAMKDADENRLRVFENEE